MPRTIDITTASGKRSTVVERSRSEAPSTGKLDTAIMAAQREAVGRRAALGATFGADAAISRYFGGADDKRARAAFEKALRRRPTLAEERDMNTTGAAGGYTVAPAYWPEFLLDVAYSSALWAHSRILHTANGAPMTFPLGLADTGNAAGVLGQNTQQTEIDPVIAQVSFPEASMWVAAGLYRASRALVQDSAIELAPLLLEITAQREARGTSAAWMPTLVAAAPAGNTITTAASGALDYPSIVSCVFALNAAYRQSPHCVWLAAPGTASILSKLTDTAGHPVLLPRKRGPDAANQDDPTALFPELLGFPLYEDPNVPAVSAGNVALVLADLSHAFCIRLVADGLTIQPLFERYADSGEIGYSAMLRADGAVGIPNALAAVKIHA